MYMEDNLVQADKIYEIPSEEWQEKGIHFRLGLPPERDNIQEMIMVIGTKEDIPFESKELREWGAGILPSYQDAITSLNRWLLGIPIDKRISEVLTYQIQKK